jgi:ribonuclease Y
MNPTALSAAFGVLLVLASAAFFFFGRRAGRTAERETQQLAKASAEQTAKRIVGEAEREAESMRKSAVISGKEELIKLRENWEVEARRRREEVEREEKRVQDREAVLDR